MINLRYHIVSIVAVFLALGLGITMGSTFLGRATLDRIDVNVRDAQNDVRNVKAQNDALSKQLALDQARAQALISQAIGREFNGVLADVPVLVLAADGVDQPTLSNLRTALTASGADFDGTLTIDTKLELSGDDVTNLAQVLGTSTTSVTQLRRIVTGRVSQELLKAAEPPTATTTTVPTTTPQTTTTVAPGSTTPTSTTSSTTVPSTTTTQPVQPQPPEVISKLIHAGFLGFTPALDGATTASVLTQAGYRYVIVTGSTASIADDDFIRPLLEDMTAAGPAPVVVASAAVGNDPEAVRDASIGPLLADSTIADQITTVDDLEMFSGIDAVIMGVEDLGEGRHGHYGVGSDAKSLLPTPVHN